MYSERFARSLAPLWEGSVYMGRYINHGTRIVFFGILEFGRVWGRFGARWQQGGCHIWVPYLIFFLKEKWHLSVRVSDMIGGQKRTRGQSAFIHPVRPLHNDIGRVQNGVAWW